MSSLDDLEGPWGQLLGIDKDEEEDLVPLVGDQFSVGRGKDADLVIYNNRFVSTAHCVLVRGEGGWVSIRDTSTNGTLLNGKKLEKNKNMKLSSGDVIKIVNRKDNPKFNVTFKFSYITPPVEELDSTLSYNDSTQTVEDSQQTLDYNPSDVLVEDVIDGGEGCGDHEEIKDVPKNEEKPIVGKKRRKESFEEAPAAKKATSTESESKEEAPAAKKATSTESESKEEVVKSQSDDGSVAQDGSKPSLAREEDSMAETLTCQICQEILHDCISLQPCMHSYCAGCYSEWMDASSTCPACRNEVERISKNHIVNNLVDAYLRANPHKRRPEEDLKELDAKNKITKDMLYPKKKKRIFHDYDYDDEYSETESESESESEYPITHATPLFPPPHTMFTSLFGPPLPAPVTLCRQCPGYVGPTPLTASHPTPPPFTCTTSTPHVLCLCCLQPMPDRRSETDMSVPPQKCDICGQAYCHMYWGCRKPGCTGCLNLFKDMNFQDGILNGVLNNGNVYESRVLKEYMEGKSLSIKDVLTVCCDKLESGEYTCSDSRTSRMAPSTRTCYRCALKNFRDLVYLYRRDVPDSELPAAVTRRPDCYWGKQCRTQVNKTHHAEKFNHICDQTRH